MPFSSMMLCDRERVRREVFKGQDAKGAHRTGSEGAALAILSYATVACAAYLSDTGLVTGTLLGTRHESNCSGNMLVLQIWLARVLQCLLSSDHDDLCVMSIPLPTLPCTLPAFAGADHVNLLQCTKQCLHGEILSMFPWHCRVGRCLDRANGAALRKSRGYVHQPSSQQSFGPHR